MPDDRWRLAALPPLPEAAIRALLGELLADLPVALVVPATRDGVGLHAALAEADLVLADWSGALVLGAAEVAAGARVAFVQQPSVGVETVDTLGYADVGVPVANTAGANTVSVAEWCLAATLALCRDLAWTDREMRAAGWPQLDRPGRPDQVELAGRRVGIVGYGAIGVACAQRYRALGCPVSYWSRRRRSAADEHGATYRPLDELMASSDVLVVVVALAPSTLGLIGAERLAMLPAGAMVVNAARGGIVAEDALLAALDRGALQGAALDVFASEPLPADSPLRRAERVLLSPHSAGATDRGREHIIGQSVANLRRAVTGEPVLDVVNGVPPRVARHR